MFVPLFSNRLLPFSSFGNIAVTMDFWLWLACHMQEQIAEDLEVARPTIVNWINDFAAEFLDFDTIR